VIALSAVLVPGVLGGLSLEARSPLTFLVEPAGGRAARTVFTLVAGLLRPRSGKVLVDGRDPAHDPGLRREIALLGDPALLAGLSDAEVRAMLPELAGLRGVAVPTARERLAVTDHLAAPATARVVLLAHPESYADPAARDAAIAAMQAAVARGAQAIVATHRLDTLLALAHGDPTAPAHLLGGGRVALTTPAQFLPWSSPARGGVTRTIHVVCDGARELAAELLASAHVAPQIASLEPISARELRLHARDPQVVVRAVAAAAHGGRAIEALTVLGASAEELLGGAA